MTTLICNNCINSFKCDVINDYFDYRWMYKFQVVMCPKCNSILYWNYKWGSSLTKLFDNLSKKDQSIAIKHSW